MIRPVILPWVNNWEITRDALEDLLAQDLPAGDSLSILLVGNGVRPAEDQACRSWLIAHPRVPVVYHSPPMKLALATIWNRSLDTCWAMEATSAWVVNNDVRLLPDAYQTLLAVRQQTQALFVSGIGVTEAQYAGAQGIPGTDLVGDLVSRGGPDFSCFLLTHACHERFRFDEGFYPAYGEDCSYHRTLMLAGEGSRIFGVNLPFHHLGGGSGTLKSLPPEESLRLQRSIDGSRAHYQRVWGGGPNQEKFIQPYGPQAFPGVTNPELQRWIQAGNPVEQIWQFQGPGAGGV